MNCANFPDEQCLVCEHLKQKQPSIRGEQPPVERINEILKQILNKLSDDSKQISVLSTIEVNGQYNNVPVYEIKKLIYNPHINFNVLETKISQLSYRTFLEFLYDCEDICHNLIVLHGPKGRIAKLTERFFDFVSKDIDLVNECLTCYRTFYDKIDPKFNPQQCTPPHEIAFVKYKSFPLWPCRLISVNDKRYQAWFFGGIPGNEWIRCFAQKKSVFSIDEAIKIFQTKPQPSSNCKTYQKSIAEYDSIMEKNGELHRRVAPFITQANGDSVASQLDDEDAENAPSNFSMAFSMADTWNSTVTNNQITNGNTKCMIYIK